MRNKKFEVIDNGYRCKKSYRGFGWLIEGNESGIDAPYDNWLVEVDNDTYENTSDDIDDMMKLTYGGAKYLGFRNLRSAKKWVMENAR